MTSLQVEAGAKADVLIEALPYIRTYRGQTVVVKIGGAPLEDAAHARSVAKDLALMHLVGIQVVVVHGGGPQVSRAMTAAGLEPSFVQGLRVTTPDAMRVVKQILVGEINPFLTGCLRRAGLRAVGTSGLDGGSLSAARRGGPDGAWGLVGDVESADPAFLRSLLEEGYVPVVASLAPDEEGELLNLNADAAAAALAAALKATKLVYLTNVDGLYRDLADQGSLVSELKASDLSAMLGSLSEGMRPKAVSAVAALEGGVGKVHILDGRVKHALLLEVFTDEGVGTQVLP
jgi:acetylglutamate kinase